MNVLVAEGIAGIEHYRERVPSHPATYARGRRLMTDEVLAAVAALRDAGVERISVGDWHMVGSNIERRRIPEGVGVRPIGRRGRAGAFSQPGIAGCLRSWRRASRATPTWFR